MGLDDDESTEEDDGGLQEDDGGADDSRSVPGTRVLRSARPIWHARSGGGVLDHIHGNCPGISAGFPL